MTISIFVLKGDLIRKIVVVRFFFCWVYLTIIILQSYAFILGLSRIPLLNSFARTPPIVWKIGWVPTPTGEMATKLPPLPIDLMHDREVLKEYIFRINSIGKLPPLIYFAFQ